jgi:hypothetical protein
MIIGVAVFPLVVVFEWHRRGHRMAQPTSRLRTRIAMTALGVAVIVSIVGGIRHNCGAGQAFTQWLVPAVSWAVVGALPLSGRIRASVFAFLFVSAAVLVGHHSALVHGSDYTGEPAWVRSTRARPGAFIEVGKTWHTALTGLYCVKERKDP